VTLVSDFIAKVQAVYKTGAATEHSYRSALEALFSGLEEDVTALNEPKRVKCGAPDFIVQRGEIVIGHAEAKDIGLDLRAMKDNNKDQQQRYLKALPNLIYTNCLDWDFYRNGERFASVTIADYLMGIQPKPDEYARLENLLREFIAQKPQSITSSRTLHDMQDARHSDDDLKKRYGLSDNRDWQVSTARSRAKADRTLEARIVPCDYRPFDRRVCMLDETMMDYPRWSLLKNALPADNFGLNFMRQTKSPSWQHAVVSKFPTPAVFVEIKDGSNFAPLYVQEDIDKTRRVNFDAKLWKKLRAKATDATHGAPDELATFDYIYGVLHCPAYRKTFAEFLKIDFPRIPWPASPAEFWDVSEKGGQLRRLHLMETAAIGAAPYPFRGDGDYIVTEPKLKDGKVWINETQHFADVPQVAWDALIGGYQPAQKWLKDRKERALSFDDVKHYQRVIKILLETNRIIGTITLKLAVPE